MSKHKGRGHRPSDKKLRKAKAAPPSATNFGELYPHEMKVGTNAKNQYRI